MSNCSEVSETLAPQQGIVVLNSRTGVARATIASTKSPYQSGARSVPLKGSTATRLLQLPRLRRKAPFLGTERPLLLAVPRLERNLDRLGDLEHPLGHRAFCELAASPAIVAHYTISLRHDSQRRGCRSEMIRITGNCAVGGRCAQGLNLQPSRTP